MKCSLVSGTRWSVERISVKSIADYSCTKSCSGFTKVLVLVQICHYVSQGQCRLLYWSTGTPNRFSRSVLRRRDRTVATFESWLLRCRDQTRQWGRGGRTSRAALFLPRNHQLLLQQLAATSVQHTMARKSPEHPLLSLCGGDFRSPTNTIMVTQPPKWTKIQSSQSTMSTLLHHCKSRSYCCNTPIALATDRTTANMAPLHTTCASNRNRDLSKWT